MSFSSNNQIYWYAICVYLMIGAIIFKNIPAIIGYGLFLIFDMPSMATTGVMLPLMLNISWVLLTIALVFKYLIKIEDNHREDTLNPIEEYEDSYIEKIEKIINKPIPSEIESLLTPDFKPNGNILKDSQGNPIAEIDGWHSPKSALSTLLSVEENLLKTPYLPIAFNDKGNLFIYSLSEEDLGSIYYIDFSFFEKDNSKYRVLVAQSYADFMTKLIHKDIDQ